jgi:nudix-type nucleoside diphosphatase (YffH/AdpP family)
MHAALRRCATAVGLSTSKQHHHPSSSSLPSPFRNAPKRGAMATTTTHAITERTITDAPKHMPAQPYPHGLKSLGGCTLETTLARLGASLSLAPLPSTGSAFIKPATVLYQLDGKQRRWDVIEAHPSIGVILYHEDLDAFVIVRQFRPAVYSALLAGGANGANGADAPPPPLHAAFTYELCAGLCDKDGKPPREIAAEEILEECGYAVDAAAIVPVTSAVSSAGTAGASHFLFFARVSEAMRSKDQHGTAGGGLAETGEAIEVLALPFDQADALVLDGLSNLSMSPGLQFGLTWAARELERGRLGGRRKGKGGDDDKEGLLTAELNLKPVLPA